MWPGAPGQPSSRAMPQQAWSQRLFLLWVLGSGVSGEDRLFLGPERRDPCGGHMCVVIALCFPPILNLATLIKGPERKVRPAG